MGNKSRGGWTVPIDLKELGMMNKIEEIRKVLKMLDAQQLTVEDALEQIKNLLNETN